MVELLHLAIAALASSAAPKPVRSSPRHHPRKQPTARGRLEGERGWEAGRGKDERLGGGEGMRDREEQVGESWSMTFQR